MTVAAEFLQLTGTLGKEKPSYVLAELNDLLTAASGAEIEMLPMPEIAGHHHANYVAAMVELAAHMKGCRRPPEWTDGVIPLSEPVFAVQSMSVRTHLLLNSPIPFRRRNIFMDTSLGGRA
jgi:hypothetical protein